MPSSNMTMVDFYILESKSLNSIRAFCCRLSEKVWNLGNSIYIRTDNAQESQLLDDLLWTYSNHSFLPHAIDNNDKQDAAIIIGHETPTDPVDLLINLASTAPSGIDTFTRIAEILNDDETIKAAGRERYSAYKQSGCTLKHHKIEAK